MQHLFLPLVLLPLSLVAAGHEPAKLNVSVSNLANGKQLSFEIQNLTDEDITRYEVAVGFPDAPGLSCGLTATVKTPKDLHPPGGCGITTDSPGKEMRWKARIVFVEFANGLIWKPKE